MEDGAQAVRHDLPELRPVPCGRDPPPRREGSTDQAPPLITPVVRCQPSTTRDRPFGGVRGEERGASSNKIRDSDWSLQGSFCIVSDGQTNIIFSTANKLTIDQIDTSKRRRVGGPFFPPLGAGSARPPTHAVA